MKVKKKVISLLLCVSIFTITFYTTVFAANYKLLPFASLYKWSNPTNITWIYVQSGTRNYYSDIRYALSAWEQKTYKLDYNEGSNDSWVMRILSSNFGNTGWHAIANPVLKLVNINDYYYSSIVSKAELVSHEVGHCNGLDDISVYTVLMRRSGYNGLHSQQVMIYRVSTHYINS